MKIAALLLAVLALSACEKPAPDRLPEVVKLQMQVEMLTHRVEALEQRNKIYDQMASDPKVVGAELQMSDGGHSSKVDYPDMAACQRAQEAALLENPRRLESYKAQGIIAGPMVTAYCIPMQ